MAMKFEVQFYGGTHNHTEYDVIVNDEFFETWVTHCPYMVEQWIKEVENWNDRQLHRLIIGLDIEWCPNPFLGENQPVAILELFVGKRCLIYQFQEAEIPDAFKNFLKNPNYTFVGVGIEKDKEKLYRDYSLEVRKSVDLREMAAHELRDPDLRFAGLKELAKVILGKDVNHVKLKKGMDDWDDDRLSNEQVLWASLHAYLSFAIGRQLQSWYD